MAFGALIRGVRGMAPLYSSVTLTDNICLVLFRIQAPSLSIYFKPSENYKPFISNNILYGSLLHRTPYPAFTFFWNFTFLFFATLRNDNMSIIWSDTVLAFFRNLTIFFCKNHFIVLYCKGLNNVGPLDKTFCHLFRHEVFIFI